jgi:hypothetical protein
MAYRGVSMGVYKAGRDKRIIALAQKISKIMRKHTDRFEALDAHVMAGIFYRGIKTNPSIARKHPSVSQQSVQ